MKKNSLREIDGIKLRWQYFTFPILILTFCMVVVPYCELVFSISMGKFDFSEFISAVWVSVCVSFILSVPLIVLSIFNRRFFGKIICVINESGIHHSSGFIKWSDVVKIEYEIDFPNRQHHYRFCHAVIYTKEETVTLVHAPLSLLSAAKKYKPNIEAKVSKNSKWMLVFFAAAIILLVPIITCLR